MKSVTVTDLVVYPIKGAQGVPVDTLVITDLGIIGDREFVIWEDGKLVDQKADQWMASIGVRHDRAAGVLTLTHALHGEYVHPVAETGTTRRAQWVLDEFDTIDQGDDVAAWVSTVLGRDVRLVSAGEPWKINFPIPQFEKLHDQPKVRFNSASPVSIANEASLTEINSHLEQPVGMDRFRMNITLEGLDPYEEDRLDQLFNDDVGLLSVTPAERCVIVTTDQETGERPQNNLLRTLRRERMKPKEETYGSGMKFGNYLAVERAGHISLGDTLIATFTD
jgi:uncharacterized protein YcbX